MSSLKSYTRIPLTLFRAKTGNYKSLRLLECPVLRPATLCYPRDHEIWERAVRPPAFGISLLPNVETLHRLKVKYFFVYGEGTVIPDDLLLYRTSREHYSLEPSLPMDVERML